MAFSSFRIKLVLRILILCATIVGFLYYVQKPQYYFTYTQLLLIAALLLVELIYFIEKGYRQLNSMLLSVKEKDFNLSFSLVEGGRVFNNLAMLLNELTDAYRKVRIEKEVHYQFLNHLIDQVNQVMVCFDDQGKVSMANRAAKKLLSLNRVVDIYSFAKIEETLPGQLESMKEGEELLLTVVINGEQLKWAAACTSIKLIDQKYKLIVLHDVRKTLQEQELDSYRKLIRVLTHEIMNSVTPILSLSQAMSESLRTQEGEFRPLIELSEQESTDIMEGYQAIQVRSRALMRFVNDFKSLTKLPAPEMDWVNVEQMINGLFTLLKPRTDEQGTNISFRKSSNIASVFVDKGLFEQVLVNLIKNAIEAVQESDNPRIDIDVSIVGSQHCVTITDNGVGIPPENFDRVFVPFFSTKKDGSGIGLSLSREIIRMHDGVLSFKSIEGHGTKFIIMLPSMQHI